jgi:CheY-like chemotaxis protein
MRDLLGATVGVTITFNDVTRQREIDRMKTEFVSTVSHELRTPLTSIKGSLHLLLSDPGLQLDATQRQLVDISVKNTDRLIRLITNILDISKIEAGHIQLELGMHSVEEFVSVAVDGIAAFAESRSILIESEVERGLPQVRVDGDRMVQVVTNLLSNAIKFSPAGSTVHVTTRRAGAQLELRVTDRGRGIAPEDMGKLFKKFQQLDGSNVRSVGGTGLGLAICRGIVEEHGGAIGVESRVGHGATFTVTLPLPWPRASFPRARARPLVGDGPSSSWWTTSRTSAGCCATSSSSRDFRVLEAGRALERWRWRASGCPISSPWISCSPDLDGFEAIRILRESERTREIPVIILSAVELGPDDTRALGRPRSSPSPSRGWISSRPCAPTFDLIGAWADERFTHPRGGRRDRHQHGIDGDPAPGRLRGADGERRPRGHRGDPGGGARSRHPRRDDAAPGRAGDAQADPRARADHPHSRHHALGQDPARRQGPGLRARRRRLRGEALRALRDAGARAVPPETHGPREAHRAPPRRAR